ncbi:MAG TPA: metallophosphoesterase family protein [Candidatus Paceibacterota bacterium]|nr:metallophosphoesterase family protein [Candidatus Paceibacterota bacterium]
MTGFRVGLISDTHDFLDPRVRDLFRGVDHILHAGDIGMPWLILQLEEIAPVTVVAGNCDADSHYKECEVLTLAGTRILLQHQVDPGHPSESLRKRLAREKPDWVVFGHTHRQFCKQITDVWYLNPGYAGKPRFNQPRSVAVVMMENGGCHPRFFPLPD